MYIQGLYNVCFLPYDFYYGTEHCLHMQEKEIKTSDDISSIFQQRIDCHGENSRTNFHTMEYEDVAEL